MYEITLETRDEETFNLLRDFMETLVEYAEDTDREHLIGNTTIEYRFDDLDMSWDVDVDEDYLEPEFADEEAFYFAEGDYENE